jgi:tRNA threonylcarbamoyladenosine biosynthesis protein TsaB
VPTLQALARAVFDVHEEAQFALPMIDARRQEVYTALIGRNFQEVWPVRSVVLDEEFFKTKLPGEGIIYSCGDGSEKIGDLAGLAYHLKVDPAVQCSARHLIAPAIDLLQAGAVEDPLHFVPFYMKPPNITQSRKQGFS